MLPAESFNKSVSLQPEMVSFAVKGSIRCLHVLNGIMREFSMLKGSEVWL